MDGDFRVGQWLVQPKVNEISGNGKVAHVEPKAMHVLVHLAEHAGEVVDKERLIQAVWADTFVTDDVLTRSVSELRKAFHDDPHEPRVIQTIPKGGYRLIAPVEFVAAVSDRRRAVGTPPLQRRIIVPAAVGLIVLAGLGAYLVRQRLAQPEKVQAGKVMLVVLPFENLSGDPKEEYFSDGMTEEMTAQLGQVSPQHLGVIGRASAMTYKGRKKTIDEIGKELHVHYVLEGSARQAGGRVRITAQLIEVGDQTHVWAQSYERDLRDILVLQSEVAQAITNEIKIKLHPQEQTRLASARPVNPEAYEALLRGRYYHGTGPEEEFRTGTAYIQRAIALDPAYARAYVDLAYYYKDAAFSGVLPVKEAVPLAKAAAGKALELDPTLADAHAVRGDIKLWFDWDWAGAEADLKRTLMLYPNNPVAHGAYGSYLNLVGRPGEAINEIQRARELDPLSSRAFGLGVALFYARRYDESIARLNEGLKVNPDFALLKAVVGWNYAQKRMYPEAVAACRSALRSEPENQIVLGSCGWIYALAGRRQDALAIVSLLKKRSPRLRVDPYIVAIIYDGLGDNDRAMEWLDRAYRERSAQMPFTKIEYWSNSLRADPRFQDLLGRMNFPP